MHNNSPSYLSFAPPPLSSFNLTNTSISSNLTCQHLVTGGIIYTIYVHTNILLFLPLYIFILYMGFQQWRHQGSAPAGATMSHSDFFTYNMMILEIFGALTSFFYTLKGYTGNGIKFDLEEYSYNVILIGQTMFHELTCLDRYMAVVHPVAYIRLRETHGVRIRNISTTSAWLGCIVWLAVEVSYWPNFPITPFFLYVGISYLVIIFFCLSVLRVLNRTGPGHVGGHKERVDHLKQRAFHMIFAITGTLLFRFAGILIFFLMQSKLVSILEGLCLLKASAIWLTVPSSLVLPLLFLHKEGKLSCCRKKTDPR